MASEESQTDNASMLRILIATDIHLGYGEDHPIRGSDSFDSFEEALQIAKAEEVQSFSFFSSVVSDLKMIDE